MAPVEPSGPDSPSQQPEQLEQILSVVRRALWGGGNVAPEAPGEPSGRLWVEGNDEAGMLVVGVEVDQAVYHLRVPDMATLAALAGPMLQPGREAAAEQAPLSPKTAPTLPVHEHVVGAGELASFVQAGEAAQAMEAIELVRGPSATAAIYTCRGPTHEAQGVEYKPFNEDAVALRYHAGDPATGAPEVIGLGAFDQAGGEGSVMGATGAASAEAAKAFDEAIKRIAEGGEPEEALLDAVRQASAGVRALGVGAVSTLAGAVVSIVRQPDGALSRKAHVVAVGDSRVLLVGKDGVVKQRTKLHNFGAIVAAGEVADIPSCLALRFASVLSRGLGTDDDSGDLACWEVEPGDRLVVETDGVGDAREFEQMPAGVWHAERCAEDQGRVVRHHGSAAEAVAALVGYALDQMADRYGKPDNIGLGVIQLTEP